MLVFKLAIDFVLDVNHTLLEENATLASQATFPTPTANTAIVINGEPPKRFATKHRPSVSARKTFAVPLVISALKERTICKVKIPMVVQSVSVLVKRHDVSARI